MGQQSRPAEVDAVIVGAGFSGLYALYRLREQGFTTRLFEAADGVGGTWYWNRYPGCRVDSEAHYYCYSFSEELRNEWKYEYRYPGQPEILKYLNFVADKFNLKKHIDFATRVTAGQYDEATHRWLIETDHGEIVRARFLITAVGNTSTPLKPDIPGIDTFKGKIYYTAVWPHEGVDFTGLRVGQIGTGSSGIQCAPLIAEEAAHLTVFQRTPNYSAPTGNHPLTDEHWREYRANHEELRRLTLASPVAMAFEPPQISALAVTPEDREAKLEAMWQYGGFRFFFSTFNDIVLDPKANETVARFIETKIRGIVKEPAVADILCDFNHPVGTKRPALDTGYYQTFNRDNVTLVSIRANPIKEITVDGISLANGDHYQLDAIVFATGFDAITGTILKLNLTGKGGQPLTEKWTDGPHTYLGMCTSGFPNMFMITGPGGPGTLTNFPVCIEQNVDWVTEVMNRMRETSTVEIEASPEAEADWGRMIAEDANKTLIPSVASWYTGANVPGKPRVFTAFFGGMAAFRERCEQVASDGYRGFVMHNEEPVVAA